MTQGFDQGGFQQGGFGQQPQQQPQQGFPQQQPQQGFPPQPGGFPQQGFQQQAPQQGGFQQGGAFASGQQAPGNTPRAFKPEGPLDGFSATPISDFIKLKEHLGSPILIRMFEITIKKVSGRDTESLECDIAILDPATRNYTLHPSQGIINSRIVGMGRRLMQSGTGVTAGILVEGEAQGGNNPPLQLANISDEATGQFAYEAAVALGWVHDQSQGQQQGNPLG